MNCLVPRSRNKYFAIGTKRQIADRICMSAIVRQLLPGINLPYTNLSKLIADRQSFAILAQGNTFGSGNVAMNPNHTWYTCCFEGVNWDVAAIPSYDGNMTAKLHADTFGILKASKNPEAAFEVYMLMLGEFAPDLLQVYGAFPGRMSLQDDALATFQENFPDADVQVFVDALSYPDNPNHESGMPNFLKASDTYTAFAATVQSTPDLDLDAEIDTFLTDLQAVFDEVE